MMRATRVGSSLLARVSLRNVNVPRRTFAASTAARFPDVVQDLYLKGLKDYKAPPEKASDADSHVQKFSPPAAPQSPEESNLASEMQSYETQEVEVEGQSSSGEQAKTEDDYFEDLKVFEDEHEGQPAAH